MVPIVNIRDLACAARAAVSKILSKVLAPSNGTRKPSTVRALNQRGYADERIPNYFKRPEHAGAADEDVLDVTNVLEPVEDVANVLEPVEDVETVEFVHAKLD